MNKKIVISIIIVCLLVIGCGLVYYVKSYLPYQKVVNEFNDAKKGAENKNLAFQATITSAEELSLTADVPYKKSTLDNLKLEVDTAKSSLRTIPEIPKKTEEIKTATRELLAPLDYTEQAEKLKGVMDDFSNSIIQLKQITNPSQDFIIERLSEISTISDIQPVTEEMDPNGKLNKPGGYTAQVYFQDERVNSKAYAGGEYANVTIDKGTDAGGSIEVYATVEDAEKRNTYLSSFDGGIFDSGLHSVHGTLVIRASSKFTATQQKEMEQEIISRLIEIR